MPEPFDPTPTQRSRGTWGHGVLLDGTALATLSSRGIACTTLVRGAPTARVAIQPEVALTMGPPGLSREVVATVLDLEPGLELSAEEHPLALERQLAHGD